MSYYPENAVYPKEALQEARQAREAEKVLSGFSSSLSNYASLLDQLADRMAVLCVPQPENPQKNTSAPEPYMSPIGTELSSRIADFDELNRRLQKLLESLSF